MVRKRSATRQDELLAAALRLFVADGVQNTSTASIAKEAGVAAGTLFLYFATRQDLINALVMKVSREQFEVINALLKPEHSAQQAFSVIWHGLLGWFRENMDAYIFVHQIRDSRIVPESVVQESAAYLGYFYAAIQKGHAEGSIKAYPPEQVGETLYQMIVAVMYLIRLQPDPVVQEQYVQNGFEIFWNGIRSERPSSEGK